MAQYSNEFDNMIISYLEKIMTNNINHYEWEHAIKKFLNQEEIAFVSYTNFITINDFMPDDFNFSMIEILLKYPPKLVLNEMIVNANNINDKENWLTFSENLWEYIHSV